MLDRIVEQMKEKQGVTEQLKAENQMLWVGKMNNIIACAEEIVVREVVLAWEEGSREAALFAIWYIVEL